MAIQYKTSTIKAGTHLLKANPVTGRIEGGWHIFTTDAKFTQSFNSRTGATTLKVSFGPDKGSFVSSP